MKFYGWYLYTWLRCVLRYIVLYILLWKNVIYIYSCVVSVDHFSCGNESQFEKWWQDSKQNPVEVTYRIHHSIISNKNKVSQTIFIFCKMWHTKSPPDCVLGVITHCSSKTVFYAAHHTEWMLARRRRHWHCYQYCKNYINIRVQVLVCDIECLQ